MVGGKTLKRYIWDSCSLHLFFSIIPVVVGGVRSIVHVHGHGYSAPGELVTCLESIGNASCDEMIRI